MDDWMTSKSNWERNTMLKLAKCGRSLSFSCYITTTTTIIFYLFIHLSNFFRNWHQQSQRRLVYPFTYPYNTHKSPNYEITCFIQLFGGMTMGFLNSTTDSFVSMLLMHVCAQLINLRKGLNNLVDEFANKSISSLNFKEGLTAIVVKHERLIRNAKTIDDCYSPALFVHLFILTFQLCFETFQIFTIITDKDSNISVFKIVFLTFYVILVLTHLYIYCYSAERLLTESTSIAYSVYECKWYDISPKEAKDLMFIVHQSKIPLRLTAGKFGNFSIEMFGTTLKTSMGYLSVLMTIKDN